MDDLVLGAFILLVVAVVGWCCFELLSLSAQHMMMWR